MSVAEDLLLVALDPTSGRVRLSSTSTGPVLGGAALLRLVEAGRLGVEGEGRKARVVVLDPTPAEDPVLEAAFGRIRQRGRIAPRTAVTRLGARQRGPLLEGMQRDGLIGDRHHRILLVPVQRFDVLDPARREDLVGRVRSVLLRGQPADATTGPLVGLLHAAGLLRLVVQRPEHRAAKRRATEVARGDWASEAVRQAVAAAQSALTVAITAGVVAGSAGS